MRVCVVTVNYGAAEHVLRELEALVPQLEELGDAEAWIVDNLSPDDSVDVLRRAIAERGYGARVRLIESPVNGGFGAGNNVAFRLAASLPDPPELFYLLNPDAVPDPGTVRSLMSFLEAHPEVAVVGGRIRDTRGESQCSTFRFPSLEGELEQKARLGILTRLLAEHRIPRAAPTEPAPVDWVSGASMMIRRSVIESVGMFDENFFLYFEEVDLCRRIREAGHEIYYIPDAAVEHVAGVTTGVGESFKRMPRFWFESRSYYYRKAFGPVGLAAFDAVAVSAVAFRRVLDLLRRRPNEDPHLAQDLVRHGLRPRFGRTSLVPWVIDARRARRLRIVLSGSEPSLDEGLDELLRRYPAATIDVYGLGEDAIRHPDHASPRVRLHGAGDGAQAGRRLAIRLAAEPPALTAFVGPDAARAASAWTRLLPLSHVAVAASLSDFLGDLRAARLHAGEPD